MVVVTKEKIAGEGKVIQDPKGEGCSHHIHSWNQSSLLERMPGIMKKKRGVTVTGMRFQEEDGQERIYNY